MWRWLAAGIIRGRRVDRTSQRPRLALPADSYDGNYTVSWNAVSGAATYELQRQTNTAAWVTVQNTSARSRTYTGQTDNRYAHRVRSCNPNGCSAYSGIESIEVDTVPLAAYGGFNTDYEVYKGDLDGDGLADLAIRQKSSATETAPVAEFVLRQISSGEFVLLAELMSSQKSRTENWPAVDIEVTTGDFNVDGLADILLENVGGVIGGAGDQRNITGDSGFLAAAGRQHRERGYQGDPGRGSQGTGLRAEHG